MVTSRFKRNRQSLGLLIALNITLIFSSCDQSSIKVQEDKSPPNILLMMADDMGFSDIGCYGSEISTPNIDALAKEGMSFTQFYNTGRCCPSRASLMTGAYAHAVGMGWMNSKDGGTSGYRGRLSDRAYTVAEALKMAEYKTYMVGKWHLTPTDAIKSKHIEGSWPWQRGFDEFYGTMEGAKDFFKPSYLYRNQQEQTTGENYYYTHAISDSAAAFIKHHPKDKPFFLYTAFYTPHFPLHAPEETIQKYKGKYQKNWEELRIQRLLKQKELGIIPENTSLSFADDDMKAWSDLSHEKQNEMDHRMAIYAAQIEELDKAVGKIIHSLKENDLYKNTFIVFLSDNGAVGGSIYGRGKEENLNRSGPYTSIGRAWGQVCNTPYRKYKAHSHEGGIISPLIVKHDKLVQAKSVNRNPLHIIDLMPTFLDLANVNLPKNKNGEKIIPLDGQSMLPMLKNPERLQEERPLFWEHEGRRAVRSQNWKLVAASRQAPWELYNLSKDPTEIENIAAQNRDKVEELDKLWTSWAISHQVMSADEKNWQHNLN